MIQFKIDQAALRAEIVAEIKRQDELSEKAALQILIEGKNAAKALCRKDTHALEQSIDTGSSVTRTGPCQFIIQLGNAVDYGAAQETGPVNSEKTWGFSPHIRPGAMIMQVKAPDIIDNVWGD